MKIRIKSPPYHSASGGIKALHYLGFLCHKLGHEIDMCSNCLNPDWGAYHQNLSTVDLTIYPESYPWSDASEGKVVRWVLFFPGRIGSGEITYPKHEMVVSYMPEYTEAARFAAQGREVIEFQLPFLELPGMEETHEKTIQGVFWVGKGKRVELSELRNLQEITRFWPTPRIELIRLFKRSRIFYSFDYNTALNYEALLCGCTVLLWDDAKKNWVNYSNPNVENTVASIPRDLKLTESFLSQVLRYFSK